MPEEHFYEQQDHTTNYLIPYFKKHIKNFEGLTVLEVGCAEAGLMDKLSELGFDVTGIELLKSRADVAKEKNPNLNVIVGDISNPEAPDIIGRKFDFIIMREVIEHIPDKETTFKNLSKLIKQGGYLYMSFPPKYSAFAGHQQVGKTILSKTPWIHLLPKSIIEMLIQLVNESSNFAEHVKMNYGTGMGISKFEKYCNSNGFETLVEELFVFRPIYKLRFGLPTIKALNIPIFREAFTFGCETLLRKKI